MRLRPLNFEPIISPLNSPWRTRPPYSISLSIVPSVTVGSPGAIHILTVAFHLPSMVLSVACSLPGMAYLAISAIIAWWAASPAGAVAAVFVASFVLSVVASAANAGAASRSAPQHRSAVGRNVVFFMGTSSVGLGL